MTTTTAAELDWTRARRRALAVFTVNKTARVSARSTDSAGARIQWAAAAWLLREGLIRRRPLSDWAELTPAGAIALANPAVGRTVRLDAMLDATLAELEDIGTPA